MSGLYLSGAGKKIFVLKIETASPEQGTLLERNFFPEAGKPLSRNYPDFAGAAWALSRISLMPEKKDKAKIAQTNYQQSEIKCYKYLNFVYCECCIYTDP